MRGLDYDVRINGTTTVRCEPEWSWHPPPERMSDFDLWFVWAGRGTLRVDGVTHELRPGAIFLLRPHGDFHGEHDPRRRLGVCAVHFDFLNRRRRVTHPPESRLPPPRARLDEIDYYERVLRQVARLAGEVDDSLARLEAHDLLRSVLIAMRRSAATDTPRADERFGVIGSITRHIRENPGELFSVEALALRAGYSVDHFTRLFTRATSLTPKEFCIRVRLDRAKQLLRESAMGIEEIAQTLGYADVFFFSRQFKERVGVAPTKWRASSGLQ